MEKGLLSLVLHAHLPFVRHPEYSYFLEENWFYEAITDTYIPLINMFEGFDRDNVKCRITMSLTPTLITMFKDPLLQDRYLGHLNRLIELSEKEIERTRNDSSFHETAWHYHEKFSRSKEVFFNRYNRDLTTAFKKFQDLGYLEIITCGATHGFLPLISRTTNAVRAQIYTATRQYEKTFEREPIGIWLPECGYMSGIDNILKEAGIRYFLTDTHGILHASPRPKYGVFAPIYCPTGVAAL